MAKLILQPAGNKYAREHYERTIVNAVDSRVILNYQPSLERFIKNHYPNGRVSIWGVTPGAEDGNVKKWRKSSAGDVVLFSGQGKIFASAVVTTKFHNKRLAETIWGYDENGETWEYIYLVNEVRKLDIPYAKFNDAMGYKPNNIIQGFTVLDDIKSTRFLLVFGLLDNKCSR